MVEAGEVFPAGVFAQVAASGEGVFGEHTVVFGDPEIAPYVEHDRREALGIDGHRNARVSPQRAQPRGG
jgi:hypothetical protein